MLEAYTSRRSVRAGEQVCVHVSSSHALYRATLQREGATPLPVWERSDIAGSAHPVPADAPINGCGWPVAFVIDTRADWPSGYYSLVLTAADSSEQADAFVVLRAAQPRSPRLLVLATTTYNAYNTFGGASTYAASGTEYAGGIHAASFLRPMARGFLRKPPGFQGRLATPAGLVDKSLPYFADAVAAGIDPWSASAGWSNWEQPFVTWLESNGYDADYAVSEDLEREPGLLSDYRLMLSVGHDEYWSAGMRDAVEGFVAGGGNVAFFSGNVAFWQVRLADDGQQMIAYKAAWREDPVLGTAEQASLSGLWSHRLVGRPENHMTGLSFSRGGYARIGGATPRSSGGYTVYRPQHWAFAGTDLAYGDQFGSAAAIVGYECDGCALSLRDGLPHATGEDGSPRDLEILAMTPVQLWDRDIALPGVYPDGVLSDVEVVGDQLLDSTAPQALRPFAHGHAVMASFSRGGTVFSAGTTDWAYGLQAGDALVGRITGNVIERLSGAASTPGRIAAKQHPG